MCRAEVVMVDKRAVCGAEDTEEGDGQLPVRPRGLDARATAGNV